MKKFYIVAGSALLAGASLLYSILPVLAAASDYEFQAVQTDVKKGSRAVVAVRLVDKRTGASVPDAVIFTTRMDMAPEGMESMTTPVEASSSTEPGIYTFKTDLVMEGGWRLQIAAKVQGEPETVQGELVFKATP